MRHLLNTYIQADPAQQIGSLSGISLTQAIVETGVHDAIAAKLNAKGKLSNNAVAEAIINNIRKTIIRDQLTDPRFYDEMSRLLDELIRRRRESAQAYQEFLREAEDLIRRLAAKTPDSKVPDILRANREAIVIYNNLSTIPASRFSCPVDEDARAALAIEIDRTIRVSAPADWKGDSTRESAVKNAIFPLVNRDPEAAYALFDIAKNQPGY
jgi:type I restriction enzyme R subunit